MSNLQNGEKVIQCEYDGTTDGMNLMIDRCQLSREHFQLCNWDPDIGLTNKWTGCIYVMQFSSSGQERNNLSGVYLKPGDFYMYKPDGDCDV